VGGEKPQIHLNQLTNSVGMSVDYNTSGGLIYSSGIRWIDCVHDIKKAIQTPSNVHLLGQNNHLRVEWTAPACQNTGYIANYIIAYCIVSECGDRDMYMKILNVTASFQHAIIPDLTPGEDYRVKIKSYSPHGESPYTAPRDVTVPRSGLSKQDILGLTIGLLLFLICLGVVLHKFKMYTKRMFTDQIDVVIPVIMLGEPMTESHRKSCQSYWQSPVDVTQISNVFDSVSTQELDVVEERLCTPPVVQNLLITLSGEAVLTESEALTLSGEVVLKESETLLSKYPPSSSRREEAHRELIINYTSLEGNLTESKALLSKSPPFSHNIEAHREVLSNYTSLEGNLTESKALLSKSPLSSPKEEAHSEVLFNYTSLEGIDVPQTTGYMFLTPPPPLCESECLDHPGQDPCRTCLAQSLEMLQYHDCSPGSDVVDRKDEPEGDLSSLSSRGSNCPSYIVTYSLFEGNIVPNENNSE